MPNEAAPCSCGHDVGNWRESGLPDILWGSESHIALHLPARARPTGSRASHGATARGATHSWKYAPDHAWTPSGRGAPAAGASVNLLKMLQQRPAARAGVSQRDKRQSKAPGDAHMR